VLAEVRESADNGANSSQDKQLIIGLVAVRESADNGASSSQGKQLIIG
jgi:hypothetical protein